MPWSERVQAYRELLGFIHWRILSASVRLMPKLLYRFIPGLGLGRFNTFPTLELKCRDYDKWE